MFSKYATLLAFAASAIAGVIKPGIYIISNAASHSNVRAFPVYTPLEVSSSSSNNRFDVFEYWDVIRNSADGTYTFKNVGLDLFAAAFDFIGASVKTSKKGTPFKIESAGNGKYVIKLPYRDLLWNAEPPVMPQGDHYIKFRLPDGSATERWTFTLAESAQND